MHGQHSSLDDFAERCLEGMEAVCLCGVWCDVWCGVGYSGRQDTQEVNCDVTGFL